MKKTNWAVLTAALVVMATVPASAAKLTVNGTLTNYWEYENSDLIPVSYTHLFTGASLWFFMTISYVSSRELSLIHLSFL